MSQIKFAEDRYWWNVRAEDGRFTVLTRQQPFRPKGTLLYTIIDRERGVRGPCNLIGQGYGDGTYDEAQCAEILKALQLHAARQEWLRDLLDNPDAPELQPAGCKRISWPACLDPGDLYPIEVSYRNNLPVRIEKERRDSKREEQ